MKITFFVAGIPVPKGSAKAFVNKKTQKAQVIQTNREKQKPWASSIAYSAMQVSHSLMQGPVMLELDFVMPRPRTHYGTGYNSDKLKNYAPYYHTSKPDLDKLERCIKDALTGVVWHDDSQVCVMMSAKVYGDIPGVHVSVTELGGNL